MTHTDTELIQFLEKKIKESVNPDWKADYERILYFFKKGLRQHIVFVIFNGDNIQSICDNWDAVQRRKKELTNLGFDENDFDVEHYEVFQ